MNNQGGLVKAYEQFTKDLKEDKDFKEFKDRAVNVKEGHSYGVVVVRTNKFMIEKTLLETV